MIESLSHDDLVNIIYLIAGLSACSWIMTLVFGLVLMEQKKATHAMAGLVQQYTAQNILRLKKIEELRKELGAERLASLLAEGSVGTLTNELRNVYQFIGAEAERRGVVGGKNLKQLIKSGTEGSGKELFDAGLEMVLMTGRVFDHPRQKVQEPR